MTPREALAARYPELAANIRDDDTDGYAWLELPGEGWLPDAAIGGRLEVSLTVGAEGLTVACLSMVQTITGHVVEPVVAGSPEAALELLLTCLKDT